jgi:hypothetical protein
MQHYFQLHWYTYKYNQMFHDSVAWFKSQGLILVYLILLI